METPQGQSEGVSHHYAFFSQSFILLPGACAVAQVFPSWSRHTLHSRSVPTKSLLLPVCATSAEEAKHCLHNCRDLCRSFRDWTPNQQMHVLRVLRLPACTNAIHWQKCTHPWQVVVVLKQTFRLSSRVVAPRVLNYLGTGCGLIIRERQGHA